MATQGTIKTAVIGYGMSAKIFHIPFVQALPQLFTLHAILQRSPASSNDASTDHPEAKIYKDITSLLEDNEVQLVIITSIPDSHFAYCKAALDAGKHVLCEKPFVPTSAEAHELAALAKQHNRVLCVYQNRRWDADFLTLQKIVLDKSLGRIVEAESHFDRHRPEAPAEAAANWKAAADTPANGAIYDLGAHLLDQLVTLFGMPARVTAFVGNQRIYPAGTAGASAGGDSFTVHLHYTDGLLATAKAGVVSAEPAQLRFWVRGERGSFKKYHLDVQEDQLKAGKRPGKNADFGIEPASANGTVTSVEDGKVSSKTVAPESPPKTYCGLYEALARAIQEQGTAPVTADQAADVLKVIELAKESSKTGRTVET